MRSMLITSWAVAYLVSLAVAAPIQSRAIHVHAAGHTFAVSEYEFQGLATFTLDGTDYEVTAHTVLLDMQELPNGMIIVQTSHTFDFGDGDTLVTLDHQLLIPVGPGLYGLRSALRITGGTGMFEGASGAFHGLPESTINFAALPPEAIWNCAGVITMCR
ncbi:MAG: hypothetical protein IT450_11170 [Phycisphaerales bacterium]|nr:hypothetical protein [Phycisphaerales bacterium]